MAQGSPSHWEQLWKQAEQAIGTGKYEEAASLYLEAADAAEVEFGRADERVVATLQALAHTQYCYIGSYARSEPTSRRLLALREEILGLEHRAVAESWISLAQALELGQGRYDEAERAYRRALEIAEHALDPQDSELAGPVHQLGQFYRNRGRYAEAEPLMRRLVDLRERTEQEKPGWLIVALGEHAGVLEKLGNNDEAEVLHRRILAVRKQQPHSDMSLGTTELRLAQLSANRGDDWEAETWYQRALASFDSATRRFAEVGATTRAPIAPDDIEAPVGYPVLRQILVGYAAVLRRRGADVEAEALERRESKLRKN
jgi:tetratricopeptide (TPR) repeat protein